MRKKLLAGLATGLFMFGMAGMAQAALTTIGTATYNGADYKLIWDDDNNGNSVVWLDYTNKYTIWVSQNTWAEGLDSSLTYHIYPAYSVAWDDNAWRLPRTVDGPYVYGYDGTTTAGFNITSSEMGHLYYEELGNLGYYDTSGNVQAGYGLINTGDFNNLFAPFYWSGTEYAESPSSAWCFIMGDGRQYIDGKGYTHYGLAIRSGQVSAVPIPGAIWFLGSGLAGLVGIRKRSKGASGR